MLSLTILALSSVGHMSYILVRIGPVFRIGAKYFDNSEDQKEWYVIFYYHHCCYYHHHHCYFYYYYYHYRRQHHHYNYYPVNLINYYYHHYHYYNTLFFAIFVKILNKLLLILPLMSLQLCTNCYIFLLCKIFRWCHLSEIVFLLSTLPNQPKKRH